jgi:hypothetical protein
MPERTAQHQSRSPHPRRQIDCREIASRREAKLSRRKIRSQLNSPASISLRWRATSGVVAPAIGGDCPFWSRTTKQALLYSSTDQGGGKRRVVIVARPSPRPIAPRPLSYRGVRGHTHHARLPHGRSRSGHNHGPPSITTVTELVHGPTGLQTRLANARN